MSYFTVAGDGTSPYLTWFTSGLVRVFCGQGYTYMKEPQDDIRVVLHLLDREDVRPFRRKAQATFVISILEADDQEEITTDAVLKRAYPFLVRSLSNHFLYICHRKKESYIFFITPEQGCYRIVWEHDDSEEELFFKKVYDRLEPLASSQLVIDNLFEEDLPDILWDGDAITHKLSISGKKLDEMNLLPTPFPLHEVVNERDMRHIKKLYGIGGLSYGNLSCRRDKDSFWMSASGVNKANMRVIGQDMLLIKGYDAERNAMKISVPPQVTVKRASVDAIEHWMIYTEHPEIGAIVHVHAWMDGIQATEINYPCGTLQLAETVAQLVRQEKNPSRAIIGLKNHGLTITGPDIDDIFERIEGRILPQVPMM